MSGLAMETDLAEGVPPGTVPRPIEPRWDLAFLGILGYLVVEYTRLAAVYPVLQPLHLGKVVIFASMLGMMLAPRQRTARIAGRGRVEIILILLLLAGALSAAMARYQDPAWQILYDAALYCLIAILIGRTVNNSWRLRMFTAVLILLNFKLSQFVIRSWILKREIGVPGWALAKFGTGAGSQGFFGESADLGLAMCVIFGIALPLIFSELSKAKRLVLFLFSLTYITAILVCGSRGAVVGLVIVSLVALLKSPHKLKAGLVTTLVLLVVLGFLPSASKDRFQSAVNWKKDQTASDRIIMWKAGLRMFRDNPFFGVGPNNFSLMRMNFYQEPVPIIAETVPHSIYIDILSMWGGVGALLFIGLFASILSLNAGTRRLAMTRPAGGRKSFEYCLAIGLDLALVGYLTAGTFLSVVFYPHLWILLGLSVGLRTSVAQQPADMDGEPPGGLKMTVPAEGSLA